MTTAKQLLLSIFLLTTLFIGSLFSSLHGCPDTYTSSEKFYSSFHGENHLLCPSPNTILKEQTITLTGENGLFKNYYNLDLPQTLSNVTSVKLHHHNLETNTTNPIPSIEIHQKYSNDTSSTQVFLQEKQLDNTYTYTRMTLAITKDGDHIKISELVKIEKTTPNNQKIMFEVPDFYIETTSPDLNKNTSEILPSVFIKLPDLVHYYITLSNPTSEQTPPLQFKGELKISIDEENQSSTAVGDLILIDQSTRWGILTICSDPKVDLSIYQNETDTYIINDCNL